jgi:hypothetical protein
MSKFFRCFVPGLAHLSVLSYKDPSTPPRIQESDVQVWRKLNVKSHIFWHISPCILLKVNRLFGGTYHLHVHNRKTNQSSNRHETCNKWLSLRLASRYLLAWFFPRPWRLRRHIPPKRRLTCHRILCSYLITSAMWSQTLQSGASLWNILRTAKITMCGEYHLLRWDTV